MNYKDIGMRIRKQRVQKNISQRTMAKTLHFSYQHLSNIERGVAKPSMELLVEIANLLEISMDYLLAGSLCPKVQATITSP